MSLAANNSEQHPQLHHPSATPAPVVLGHEGQKVPAAGPGSSNVSAAKGGVRFCQYQHASGTTVNNATPELNQQSISSSVTMAEATAVAAAVASSGFVRSQKAAAMDHCYSGPTPAPASASTSAIASKASNPAFSIEPRKKQSKRSVRRFVEEPLYLSAPHYTLLYDSARELIRGLSNLSKYADDDPLYFDQLLGSAVNIKHAFDMGRIDVINGTIRPRNTSLCHECITTVSSVWRSGPDGPRTLCNACGLRYYKQNQRRAMAAKRLEAKEAAAAAAAAMVHFSDPVKMKQFQHYHDSSSNESLKGSENNSFDAPIKDNAGSPKCKGAKASDYPSYALPKAASGKELKEVAEKNAVAESSAADVVVSKYDAHPVSSDQTGNNSFPSIPNPDSYYYPDSGIDSDKRPNTGGGLARILRTPTVESDLADQEPAASQSKQKRGLTLPSINNIITQPPSSSHVPESDDNGAGKYVAAVAANTRISDILNGDSNSGNYYCDSRDQYDNRTAPRYETHHDYTHYNDSSSVMHDKYEMEHPVSEATYYQKHLHQAHQRAPIPAELHPNLNNGQFPIGKGQTKEGDPYDAGRLVCQQPMPIPYTVRNINGDVVPINNCASKPSSMQSFSLPSFRDITSTQGNGAAANVNDRAPGPLPPLTPGVQDGAEQQRPAMLPPPSHAQMVVSSQYYSSANYTR